MIKSAEIHLSILLMPKLLLLIIILLMSKLNVKVIYGIYIDRYKQNCIYLLI